MSASAPPKKYIKGNDGSLVLNPAYRAWKNNLVPATTAVTIVETPIADTYYAEEEGAEDIHAPDYGLGSSEVIKGKYVVPKGVAVEMIKNFNGKKNLLNDCPQEVRELLIAKDAFDIYDKFVQTIYDDKTNTNGFGRWRDAQFVSKIDVFSDDFAKKGIKVALCARKSDGKHGNTRWLEFIDVSVVGNYVPQYDLSNMSGQIIRTVYTELRFPKGVAVEELKQWSGREKLKGKIPIEVEKMLEKHDLMNDYRILVSDFVSSCSGSNYFKNWDIEKLKNLIDKYDVTFAEKGVDLFISHKQEWVSHGKGGHMEYFRWIEFVDREQQPNYVPQRDADENDEKCSIM